MAKADAYRSSAMVYDGAAVIVASTGAMTFATSAADSSNGANMIPYSGYIESVDVSIIAAATTSTPGLTINVGSATDADAFIVGAAIDATTVGVYRIDLTATDGTIVSRNVAAGEIVQVQLPQATVAGTSVTVGAAVVVTPRDPN